MIKPLFILLLVFSIFFTAIMAHYIKGQKYQWWLSVLFMMPAAGSAYSIYCLVADKTYMVFAPDMVRNVCWLCFMFAVFLLIDKTQGVKRRKGDK